jgi:hemolysin-activating ACP:hemolysin acyltransferase
VIRIADDVDFMHALRLWTTTAPYRDQPSRTIAWRLVPAFANGRLMMMGDDGFVTWGWMTADEFETRKYSGREVFTRQTGERLVIVDAIIPADVPKLAWRLREFYRAKYPDVTRVWAHRGARNGSFCI